MRLTPTLINSAIVLVQVSEPHGVVLVNPYPSARDTRGLASPWYTYRPTDDALYAQYRDQFDAVWDQAAPVTPRSTVGTKTDWPFKTIKA